jgi:fumarylacetoacetase
MTGLDRTHDPARRSWVESANAHRDFPVQNLPFGCVRTAAGERALVVAIGEEVLLLPAALDAGWGQGAGFERSALTAAALNALAARPADEWHAVRAALSDALSDPAWEERLRPALRPRAGLEFMVPFDVRDYTDFYASIFHATNVGSMFRPDHPLLPNYKWVPIGYHGRASSIVVSGTPVRRPRGQIKSADADVPVVTASRSLDYELELGLLIGGSNPLGTPVPIRDASSRLFGISLLNDWSARDLQAWEYQPLGPFLAKNFATTIAPWVITADALTPFRNAMPPRPDGDPAPLEYLRLADDVTIGLELDVLLRTPAMRQASVPAARISRVDFARAMYWSPAQLIAHHTSNGCNLRPGDLLGTGTVSGSGADTWGCLLERTWRGRDPLPLPGGETRRFLEDGDEVIFRGHCRAEGAVTIGLGECRGTILPA